MSQTEPGKETEGVDPAAQPPAEPVYVSNPLAGVVPAVVALVGTLVTIAIVVAVLLLQP